MTGDPQAGREWPGPDRFGLRGTREVLAAHGLAPSKRLGQHFVVDPNTVRKMVRDAGVRPGETVLEVGPGAGALTAALLEAGAHVVAVEVDSGLHRMLAELLGGHPRLRLVHADALRADLAGLTGGTGAMVANLPYHVATGALLAALEQHAVGRAHVMVQREVGERWAARPGDPRYGAASVKVASLADARVVAPVPRTAFWPRPEVDSVTVRADARRWPHPVPREQVVALVEAGFASRRKLLRNTLRAHAEPTRVERALVAVGAGARARAEELDLDRWAALAAELDASGA